MEEILASIRQIISEDGGSAAPKIDGVITEPAGGARAGRAASEGPNRTFEPTASTPREAAPRAESAAAKPAAHDAAGAPMAMPASAKTAQEPPAEAAREEPAAGARDEIETEPDYGEFMRRISEDAAKLGALEPAPTSSRTPAIGSAARRADDAERPLLSRESGQAVSGAFGALAHTLLEQNARTLEDVVTEMLQPMLKDWLDDNLPSIVERKVREEIERVSRGRR